MPITVCLTHKTHYHYDRKIQLAPQTIRLRPAPHSKTAILSYSLKVEPKGHFLNWLQDPFSNYMARVVFPEKTDHFKVEVELYAELNIINPFDFFLESYAENFPFSYSAELKEELYPFLKITDNSAELKEYFKTLPAKEPKNSISTITFISNVLQKIKNDIFYLIRMEPGVQSCQQTLSSRAGSCRDSAFLLLQILRMYGLAARFASGYLIQLTPDIRVSENDGPSQDFTDLHAWVEVFLPGAGWIGLDATSGMFASEGHIPLACTPEPGSAAPINGFLEQAEVKFEVEMKVVRVIEKPRTTKPLDDISWQQVLKVGEEVEKKIKKNKIPLTMGGEPTFTARENRDLPEWNTVALGDHKKKLAAIFVEKIKQRFAPDGLLQFTQGKWYPGELTPRWSFNCYDIEGYKFPGFANNKNQKTIDIKDLKKFATTFADHLNIDKKFLQPAYEDIDYYQWKSSSLPSGDMARLSDFDRAELERGKKILSQYGKEENPVGFSLPLIFDDKLNRWQTCIWQFARKKIFLIPGDSALGYRLPLDSILQVQDLILAENNNFDKLPKLKGRSVSGNKEDNRRFENQLAKISFRTSLSFELREGFLYVFLPYLTKLEHWVDLVVALNQTAKDLKINVLLEGYEPPQDQRLKTIKVTPDPAVIEVNIAPVDNWADMVANTRNLYECASESGLIAEKYLLDGRICGTGGGNHITLGAKTPADSPFFKKPTLLGQLITFWQHHPSLSYLFSGLFIGPTSQAPRVDEVRTETLYELEIALKQLAKTKMNMPWVIDRLLRNFLIDLTGNTHRSEICIDKLYSPDSSTGRLGIVELRGFEMPPHFQMSLIQQLLVRSIVLRLWQGSYHWDLERFGRRLQDQFMLPYFIWQDFLKVTQDLQHSGIEINPSWFLPFFEFRFPLYGRVNIHGMEVELRMALEPWNVLGETVFTTQTSRPVDSSIERIQVQVKNFEPSRYSLVCNGFVLPLHQTSNEGEYISGVRFKAWDQTFSLHPYIAVQSPLNLEIWDRHIGKYIGGCSYHVSHPGGRSYDTIPVNENEAEGRRISRFSHFGHSHSGAKEPVNLPNAGLFCLDMLKAVVLNL